MRLHLNGCRRATSQRSRGSAQAYLNCGEISVLAIASIFGKDGERVVILLGGGTKKRQQTDIEAAKALWLQYKLQKREE